jgi:hypothetical protein
MSDVTPDDKIARLVHLVLEAVDHRLADIRTELQQIDDRLTRLERAPASGGHPAGEGDARFDQLQREIDRVRGLVDTLAARPAPTAAAPSAPTPSAAKPPAQAIDTSMPSLPPLSSMSTGVITGQVPLLQVDPASGSPAGGGAAPTAPSDTSELIDLDRLSDLLSARLDQINLPRPT